MMMIILGSVIAALAFAAPVDVKERPLLAHILDFVDSLNYIGASNGAIVEYFEIHRDPDNEEKYHKMLEWGKKWNIEFVKNFRYDAKTDRIWSVAPDIDGRDSRGNLVTKRVLPPPAKTFTEEEYNASATRNEALIRYLLVREGLSEKAIDEYFAGSFHLRPVDYPKMYNMIQWCYKYLKGVEKLQLVSLMAFTETVVTGAEEQPPVVETTTVTVETTTAA